MDSKRGQIQQHEDESEEVYQSCRQVAIRAGVEAKGRSLPRHGLDQRPTGPLYNWGILPGILRKRATRAAAAGPRADRAASRSSKASIRIRPPFDAFGFSLIQRCLMPSIIDWLKVPESNPGGIG